MVGTCGGLRWPLFLMIPYRILAELPADSLGAYVISMARTASDVLAVVLLQRECGVKDILRVAPLFETLDDLTNAPGTIKTLFSNEWYLKHIKGSQECMIGERTPKFERVERSLGQGSPVILSMIILIESMQ